MSLIPLWIVLVSRKFLMHTESLGASWCWYWRQLCLRGRNKPRVRSTRCAITKTWAWVLALPLPSTVTLVKSKPNIPPLQNGIIIRPNLGVVVGSKQENESEEHCTWHMQLCKSSNLQADKSLLKPQPPHLQNEATKNYLGVSKNVCKLLSTKIPNRYVINCIYQYNFGMIIEYPHALQYYSSPVSKLSCPQRASSTPYLHHFPLKVFAQLQFYVNLCDYFHICFLHITEGAPSPSVLSCLCRNRTLTIS